MEADILPKPQRCKNDMARSALSFDCTIGDIQKLVHGLLRQRLPAVDMKKEDLPMGAKQKAYYIGGQQEDSFHLFGFNINFIMYLILDSQLFYTEGTFLIIRNRPKGTK